MEELTVIFEPQYIKSTNHWIVCDGSDNFICEYLNITKEKFFEIVKKYNGETPKRGDHYFYIRDDCEKFLNSEEMAPYFIMDQLTK